MPRRDMLRRPSKLLERSFQELTMSRTRTLPSPLLKPRLDNQETSTWAVSHQLNRPWTPQEPREPHRSVMYYYMSIHPLKVIHPKSHVVVFPPNFPSLSLFFFSLWCQYLSSLYLLPFLFFPFS
ncbi:hypothetical protein L5515_009812 [Caenorhabditis briggsae]|uniref:Uncharacterized protein n=1 Tax=Caenorhabditis briggsae TaxID=6238 RepID=A0AAE9A5H4_CAEBR|nr:hypothetical protein L3Y34_010014 [Caenorhabditis briggsae]UMM38365.1 hypothetical protein L5515_009812 [Caenorhabditis briggsae]